MLPDDPEEREVTGDSWFQNFGANYNGKMIELTEVNGEMWVRCRAAGHVHPLDTLRCWKKENKSIEEDEEDDDEDVPNADRPPNNDDWQVFAQAFPNAPVPQYTTTYINEMSGRKLVMRRFRSKHAKNRHFKLQVFNAGQRAKENLGVHVLRESRPPQALVQIDGSAGRTPSNIAAACKEKRKDGQDPQNVLPRSIRGRRTISSPQLSFVYTLSPSAASFGVIAWFNHHIWNAAVLTSATTLTLSLLNLYAGLGVHERSNRHIVLAPFAAYSIGTPLLADEVDASIIPKAANLQQFTGRLNSSQHIFRCRSRFSSKSDDTSLLQGCAFNKLVSFQIELFFNSHGGPADPLTVPISSLEAIAASTPRAKFDSNRACRACQPTNCEYWV
ncbi:hypothetical protein R3P38DRAFT_2788155 [Favolaschia claudopus]|uniref:Uncharacterized protein n=1 Tax=Favolaschia claudopus TaxID=2862362 RepID=A0AAW0ALG9_9AGAR